MHQKILKKYHISFKYYNFNCIEYYLTEKQPGVKLVYAHKQNDQLENKTVS